MEGVKSADGFVGKGQSRSLDHIGTDSEDMPVVRCFDKTPSTVLRFLLGNLVECTSADEDSLALDKGKVRGENEFGAT
jgi:hypothetical protein